MIVFFNKMWLNFMPLQTQALPNISFGLESALTTAGINFH